MTGTLYHVDADRLGWWLCERQLPSGGLNGLCIYCCKPGSQYDAGAAPVSCFEHWDDAVIKLISTAVL